MQTTLDIKYVDFVQNAEFEAVIWLTHIFKNNRDKYKSKQFKSHHQVHSSVVPIGSKKPRFYWKSKELLVSKVYIVSLWGLGFRVITMGIVMIDINTILQKECWYRL